MEQKVWFTADTHFHHKNICKYTGRAEFFGLDPENPDMDEHDKKLIEMWNSTIGKKDIVYILGDFSFMSTEDTRKILSKLHGKKHIILGNHDASIKGLENYFESVSQIKTVNFKKTVFPFLDENFVVCMCHFPMVSWDRKPHGAVHLHGHCHGSLDAYNNETGEFRLDVGFDAAFAGHNFVSLEQVYSYFKNMAGVDTITDYLSKRYEERKKIGEEITISELQNIRLVKATNNDWKLVFPEDLVYRVSKDDSGEIRFIDLGYNIVLSQGCSVGDYVILKVFVDETISKEHYIVKMTKLI